MLEDFLLLFHSCVGGFALKTECQKRVGCVHPLFHSRVGGFALKTECQKKRVASTPCFILVLEDFLLLFHSCVGGFALKTECKKRAG